ncbi:MAG: class IV adenylate cyclase [Candidatus Nanoarchaeia archaeon]|jgi:adenylate cyclase class 2
MKEIEAKFRLINADEFRALLELKGFRLINQGTNEDNYYTDPDGSFITDRVCLRLRKKNNETVFTFKPKRKQEQDVAVIDEIEFKVDDFYKMEQTLKGLGYLKAVSFEKNRETYEKDGLKICLDNVKELGWFAELEIMSDDEEQAINKINMMSAELNLTQREKHNYRDLILLKNESSWQDKIEKDQ